MNLMKHDRIVEFIDLDVDTFSIIMELMPLGTLSGLIQKKQGTSWSWKERVQIMLDICEGGAFLHSSSYPDGSTKRIMLHQDLKSPNVLLSKEHGIVRAKLADFGLACEYYLRSNNAVLKEISATESAMSKSVQHNGGTQTYWSPELFLEGAKFTKVIPHYSCVESRHFRGRDHLN